MMKYPPLLLAATMAATAAHAQERAHDREHDPEAATQAQVRAERATDSAVETRADVGRLDRDHDPAYTMGAPEAEIRLERVEDDHEFRTEERPAIEERYLADDVTAGGIPIERDEEDADQAFAAIAPVRVPDPETVAAAGMELPDERR